MGKMKKWLVCLLAGCITVASLGAFTVTAEEGEEPMYSVVR